MTKAKYVDGFVLTVPKAKGEEYRKLAVAAGKIWRRHGALEYKECVIDDAAPKRIVLTFPKMIKPRKGEQVWFSYITYKSRAHRDAVNKKVMAYFGKKYGKQKDYSMPFDMKRMAYAGFTVKVSA